ncbi:MAG: class I SAM-dependent methyltransferase, partial [Flavobacteriales bacterium]
MESMVKKIAREFFLFLSIPKAIRFFKKRSRIESPDPKKEVGLVFDWEQKVPFLRIKLNIRPIQKKIELLRLFGFLQEKQLHTLCEIGTARGGLLYLFTRMASSNANIVSIDLPKGRFGGGYPAWKIPLYRSFARMEQRIRLIRGDSHNTSVKERLRDELKDSSLDLLFIDGDHSYEGVKKDFEMYSPLVKREGVVGF